MKNKYYPKDEWSNRPDNCAHRYIIPSIIQIIQELNLRLDSKILDIGCGGGSLINRLYNLGFTDICGFDASDPKIHIAKTNFQKIADRFFIHDAYERNLPNAIPKSYDLAISMEVIEHLYDPEVYLGNLHHWLNYNGYLIITTPYHGYIKNLLISLSNGFEKHFNPLCKGGHIKFFSKKTLLSILDKKRFKILEIKGVGGMPYIWKSIIFVAQKCYESR